MINWPDSRDSQYPLYGGAAEYRKCLLSHSSTAWGRADGLVRSAVTSLSSGGLLAGMSSRACRPRSGSRHAGWERSVRSRRMRSTMTGQRGMPR